MTVLRLLPILLLLVAVPAHAERLTFDHRLYPALKAVLDSGDTDKVMFDESNPQYIIDRIAVQGKSAADWSEALEIIARTPTRDVRTAADWVKELRARADQSCTHEYKVIAKDSSSITFERRSPGCAAARAQTILYRVVAGKRSLFLLAALAKGEMSETSRRQWLELMKSAHIN